MEDKSPCKLLQKLGNMLLESSRTLAASKHQAGHSKNLQRQPSSSRKRHRSLSQEALQAATISVDNDVATVDSVDSEPSGLLARADKLQKSMKLHTKKSHRDDNNIFLNVCAVKETKSGVYVRTKTPHVEIKVKKDDNYKTVCRRAAKACNIKGVEGKELCLFRNNGVKILNETITTSAGKKKAWTIGNYFTSIKKAAGNVKLGIGSINIHSDDSGEGTSCLVSASKNDILIEESSGQHNSNIRVMYYTPPVSAAREHRIRKGLTREFIWGCIKGHDISTISDYQPEEDGYKVLSLHLGGDPLLTSSDGGTFVVKNSNSSFEILWQSPANISVSSTRTAVMIYCVASKHGHCSYAWHNFDNKQQNYPQTSILYVTKAGLYQCTATMGSQVRRGDIITVEVSTDSEIETPPISISRIRPPEKKRRRKYVNNPSNKTSTSNPSDKTFHKRQFKDPNKGTKEIQDNQLQGTPENTLTSQSSNVQVALQEDHLSSTPDKNAQVTLEKEHFSSKTSNQKQDGTPDKGVISQSRNVQGQISLWDAAADFGACINIDEAPVADIDEAPVAGIDETHTPVKVKDDRQKALLPLHNKLQVREFCIDDLKSATGNFSNLSILGKGGFGVVHFGIYKGTKMAIKKLTENATIRFSQYEGKEVPDKFTMNGQLSCEMWALTRCRHRNLIDLMGYCTEPPCLIYELMEQGNLYDRLHKKSPVLTIQQRSRILKDACRGLTWLHSMKPQIMHGDIKTRNILLDNNLTGKLGDFGFTQEIPTLIGGRSVITAAIVAKSLGYAPPEMDMAQVSCKSDMYCYGVVGLEVFTRMPPFCRDWEDPKLVEHVDDQRQSIEGYKEMYDKSAGEIPHYLVLLYRRFIEACLLKHSRRCTSAQVMEWWSETNY